MKSFFQFVLRSVAGFCGMVTTWLVSMFALGQTFLISSLFAFIGGVVVYVALKQIMHFRLVRGNGLTRREYKFIDKNLKEAKEKIARLQKSIWRVKSVDQAKYNLEMVRTVKKIYSNTKNDPKRFYKAEGFYYKHLDSLVELAEKYAFLSTQPVNSKEMADSLRDTRRMLFSLGETVKKDLHLMLNDDMDTLHFELDVAKNSVKKAKGRISK
ncbi:5-bromo-4-chloroindolyl phosphate hydrolysis family protein [Oceanobacillus bengalensis]|uniref:Protein xpaC n=1 Tax=Oceanobacillus bengalensis TaxID=1435466 RepID=A0A494YX81_9BACI|nr:5-bromo-4-chloroindolyl phosphate hydrolysis family protein [Oceanobacillus bengalensis]RKQ14772.1 protein xpaC [Oceanobacillus bengalensis]